MLCIVYPSDESETDDEIVKAIKACQGGGSTSANTTIDGSAIVGCSLDGGNRFVVQVRFDESTNIWTYSLTDGTPVVEGVDFIVCDQPASASKIVTICKCDDVNSDGSDIVSFIEAYFVESDGVDTNSTLLGFFTDETLSVSYTLQGDNVECDSIGADAKILQKRIQITSGESWSPTLTTQSYTIRVDGAGANFTDSDSNVTDLGNGEVLTFSNEEYDIMDDTSVVSSTGANVFISYTELG